ncbi:hypothetical protein LguiB_005869 [Lonicera macranthoides]
MVINGCHKIALDGVKVLASGSPNTYGAHESAPPVHCSYFGHNFALQTLSNAREHSSFKSELPKKAQHLQKPTVDQGKR